MQYMRIQGLKLKEKNLIWKQQGRAGILSFTSLRNFAFVQTRGKDKRRSELVRESKLSYPQSEASQTVRAL